MANAFQSLSQALGMPIEYNPQQDAIRVKGGQWIAALPVAQAQNIQAARDIVLIYSFQQASGAHNVQRGLPKGSRKCAYCRTEKKDDRCDACGACLDA